VVLPEQNELTQLIFLFFFIYRFTGLIKHICLDTCNKWYDACSIEFFAASNSVGGALTPCLEHHMICSRLDTFVKSGSAFCKAMGFEPQPNAVIAMQEGEEEEEYQERKKGLESLKCFDGSVPNSYGVATPLPKSKIPNMEKLFKKYRKTRAGKAADSFVRFLDGIPTWLTIALSILIGALLFGRIWFSGVNDDGEYLGGGRTVGGSSLSSVSDDFE